MSPSDEKLWATLIHVAGIFYVLPSLIGYLVLKDRGPFIRMHTRTALNFQITLALVSAISVPLMLVGIGFLLLGAVAILNFVLCIVAAMAANNGHSYEYPLAIKFVQ